MSELSLKAKILPVTSFVGRTDEFTLHHLTQDDVDRASTCLADAFMKEAIVGGLGIPWDDFYLFSKLFCQHTVHDHLSVIAKNGADDIVGVLVNEDVTPILTAIQERLQNSIEIGPLQFYPAGIEYFLSHEKFIPVFELLDALDTQYVQYRIANKMTEKCLHTFMGAVNERAQGERLLLRMIHRAHMQSQNCGFVYSIGEYTNYFSSRVGMKLGGEKLTEIVYDEFSIEEGRVFPYKGINAHFTEQSNVEAKARHQLKESLEPFKPLANCAYSLELIQIPIKEAMDLCNTTLFNRDSEEVIA